MNEKLVKEIAELVKKELMEEMLKNGFSEAARKQGFVMWLDNSTDETKNEDTVVPVIKSHAEKDCSEDEKFIEHWKKASKLYHQRTGKKLVDIM